MSALRNTIMALGFMVAGGIGAVTLSAVAQEAPDQQLARPMQQRAAFMADLTEDQKSALQAFRETRRSSAEANRAERDAERQEMRIFMQEEPINRRAVHRTIDDRADERIQAEHDRADQMMDLLEYFTPEQREQIAERMEQRRHMRGQGMRGQRGQGMRGQRGQGMRGGMGQGQGYGQGYGQSQGW